MFADDDEAIYQLRNLYEGRNHVIKLKKLNNDTISFMEYKHKLPKIHDHYNFEPNTEYDVFQIYDNKFKKLSNFTGIPDIVGRVYEKANKPTQSSTSIHISESVNIISGPWKMSYHKNVFGKNIYLISDFDHTETEGECKTCTSQNNCQLLHNWLDNRFRNTKVKIDFFLEQDFVEKELTIPKDYNYDPDDNDDVLIDRIRAYFRKCLASDKTECSKKYPNTRIHYADMRSFLDYNDDGEMRKSQSVIVKIWDLLPYSFIDGMDSNDFRDFFALLEIISDGKWIKNYMINLPMTPNLEDLLPKFGIYQKFVDSWDNIEYIAQNRIRKNLLEVDENIRKKILEFYNQKLSYYFKNIDAMIIQVKKIKNIISNKNSAKHIFENMFLDVNQKQLNSTFHLIFEPLIQIASMQMDLYLLARMFKNSLNDGKEVYVFAGDKHIQNYKEFIIKTLGNKNYSMSTKLEYRCIDISSINKGILTTFTSLEIIDEYQIRTILYLSENESYTLDLNNNQNATFININNNIQVIDKYNRIDSISNEKSSTYGFSKNADFNFIILPLSN